MLTLDLHHDVTFAKTSKPLQPHDLYFYITRGFEVLPDQARVAPV